VGRTHRWCLFFWRGMVAALELKIIYRASVGAQLIFWYNRIYSKPTKLAFLLLHTICTVVTLFVPSPSDATQPPAWQIDDMSHTSRLACRDSKDEIPRNRNSLQVRWRSYQLFDAFHSSVERWKCRFWTLVAAVLFSSSNCGQ
jgi:hypothetical protein